MLLWLHLFFSSVVTVFSQEAVVPVNCSALKFTVQGRYYRFWVDTVQRSYSFSSARTDCTSVHNAADLAILKDQVNIDLIKNQSLGSCQYIGLSQDTGSPVYQSISNWSWIDGSEFGESIFGFVDWTDAAQPNNPASNGAFGSMSQTPTFKNVPSSGSCGKVCAIPGKYLNTPFDLKSCVACRVHMLVFPRRQCVLSCWNLQ
jgi:hypothetical protein